MDNLEKNKAEGKTEDEITDEAVNLISNIVNYNASKQQKQKRRDFYHSIEEKRLDFGEKNE